MEQLSGLGDVIEQAMNQIRQQLRQKFKEANEHAGIWESLRAFAAAVDWKEPWILGVLGVQAMLLLTSVAFRGNTAVTGFIFAIAAVVLFNAEALNGLCAQYWKSFAKQPYFDDHGIFFSALVSTPLLLIMFFLLLNYLASASALLVKMKRKELRYKARQRAREEAQAGSADNGKKGK